MTLASADSSASTLGLPPEMVEHAQRRLRIAVLVIAAVNLLYLILYYTIWSEQAFLLARINGWTMVVAAPALAGFLWKCERPHKQIVWLASAFEILFCFSVGLTEAYAVQWDEPFNQISWVCVVIVFWPALVPGPRRSTLLSAFGSAVAHSVALGVFLVLEDMDFTNVALSAITPVYICAALSLVPSRLMLQMSTAVGQARRLGSYQLIEKLGQGGMGEVWRARHRLLVRPAAVKLIKPELFEQNDVGQARVRFEREAQATASLASPHTIEIYDFGVAVDGTFYYVMELLDGIDLERLVKEVGPQPPERVASVLVQACDSLDDAHSVGLIHRDIKPANIFLAKKGRRRDFVTVLDFGLVKESSEDVKLSRANEVRGTPAYLSPEQATGEHDVGPKSDVYALGCVAYWLLTGSLVFEEDNAMKMAIAHSTKAPIRPSERTEVDIPAELDDLVMRCLAKDPADRPDSAVAIAEALDELAAAWTIAKAEAWWEAHHIEPASVATGDTGAATLLSVEAR
jgi:serine/threonine-protein kinase